jgi:hypothetical protein
MGERPYDFKIQSAADQDVEITIQVKLQRMDKGIPLVASKSLRCYPDDFFIVEVQKTRSGEKDAKKTRPYSFGEFDILAVSMHPSTGDWSKFMYTAGNWLLPRRKLGEEHLIKVLQPVSGTPDEVWTDDLPRCMEWFLGKEKKVVFDLPRAQTIYSAAQNALREGKKAARKAEEDRKRAEKRTQREHARAAKKVP